MLAALVIVFREVIEAGLIVGIVLAATKGVPRRSLWVGYGIAGGVAGACLVAAFAGQIASFFQGSGQELFNATILFLAVGMLTWHNVWMSSHGRAMADELKKVGAAVASGQRTLAALAVVVGIAVLREGSEVVLFLYGLSSQGATSIAAGAALGIATGATLSALMYFGLLAIPTQRLFAVTTALITLLAAGMASQAVLLLQNGGFINGLTDPLWNTSWLLPQDGEGTAAIFGRMLHTLVGYSDSPDGAQLIAYGVTIAVVIVLMRFANKVIATRRLAPNAT